MHSFFFRRFTPRRANLTPLFSPAHKRRLHAGRIPFLLLCAQIITALYGRFASLLVLAHTGLDLLDTARLYLADENVILCHAITSFIRL
jgi:hypothetical protein